MIIPSVSPGLFEFVESFSCLVYDVQAAAEPPKIPRSVSDSPTRQHTSFGDDGGHHYGPNKQAPQ